MVMFDLSLVLATAHVAIGKFVARDGDAALKSQLDRQQALKEVPGFQ